MSVALVGCKVGADDPGLTFSSRDGRLMRAWNLIGYDRVAVDSSDVGIFTNTTSYANGVLTEVGFFGTSSDSYTLVITFDKGGNLTVVETEDGDITEENDAWEWLSADKNKSELAIGGGSDAAGIWSILRLTGKELVLERNTRELRTIDGDLFLNTDDFKLTFEAAE